MNSDRGSNDPQKDDKSGHRSDDDPAAQSKVSPVKWVIPLETLFEKYPWWIGLCDRSTLHLLNELFCVYKVSIDWDKRSEEISCFATDKPRTITIGLHAIERLWARAYGYNVLFAQAAEVANRYPFGPAKIDLAAAEVASAMELLHWSAAAEFDDEILIAGGSAWPVGLPRLDMRPGRADSELIADELMFMAVADIVIRQIGHIVLKHNLRDIPQSDSRLRWEDWRGNSDAVQIVQAWEEEVDAWAGDLLLQGVEPTDKRLTKRLLGMILAFAWIDSFRRHNRGNVVQFLGHTWTKLFRRLKHCVSDPEHSVWSYFSYVGMLQTFFLSIRDRPDTSGKEGEDLARLWVDVLDHT